MGRGVQRKLQVETMLAHYALKKGSHNALEYLRFRVAN
jgi:hypothetical protein